MTLKNNTITLRVVHVSKTAKLGGFEAVMRRDDEIPRTKTRQCQFTVTPEDTAYEIIDLWAEDMAKKHGVPYIKVPKKDLLDILRRGTGRNDRVSKIKLSVTNQTYFTADIKASFASDGYDKVKPILEAGMALLEELEGERVTVAKNATTAKDNLARSMYQTWLDTGVDTSVYCNDSEIKDKYNTLREEAERLI